MNKCDKSCKHTIIPPTCNIKTETFFAAVYKEDNSLMQIDIGSGYPYKGSITNFKKFTDVESCKDYIKHWPDSFKSVRLTIVFTTEEIKEDVQNQTKDE